MENIFEGEYTKIITLDHPLDGETVDALAAEGWILVDIIPFESKFAYWFQSKRKIYTNVKIQSMHHKI